MIPPDTHLQIGSLLFEGLDQIDLTGPFEVLSRVPNSTYRVYGPSLEPSATSAASGSCRTPSSPTPRASTYSTCRAARARRR